MDKSCTVYHKILPFGVAASGGERGVGERQKKEKMMCVCVCVSVSERERERERESERERERERDVRWEGGRQRAKEFSWYFEPVSHKGLYHG